MYSLDDLDTQLLRRAAQMVNERFGSTVDLPEPLADTICNVCYQYADALDAAARKGGMPKALLAARGSKAKMRKVLEEMQRLPFYMEMLEGFVPQIREINKTRQPNRYGATLSLLLDICKYRMPNALKQSELIRIVRRIKYKRDVKEVPGLARIMLLYGREEIL